MGILMTIVAVVVGFILWHADMKNREKELEISELKQMVKRLELRESSLEESKNYYEEKADQYETAYYDLYKDYEKLREERNDTNSTLH